MRGSAGKRARTQVSLEKAAKAVGEYHGVVWAHHTFVPRKKGISIIASSLDCDSSAVKVADVTDVRAMLNGGEPSEAFEELLPEAGRPLLLVCMHGNTSLTVAKVLRRSGVNAESLRGGLTGLPMSRGYQQSQLVQIARR